jgi:nitrite reductase/ring-hydroxylating ferredoxin subunit
MEPTSTAPGGAVADWQPALPAAELDEQGMRPVVIGAHRMIMLRAEGEVHAFRDACPHEGYALSKHAERQDFVIVCNKHLWEFDAATGEHVSRVPRPQCNLVRYPTRLVDGTVEVNVAAVALAAAPVSGTPRIA